jgi:site-specific DNA-methyltransferase (adenine-specific)
MVKNELMFNKEVMWSSKTEEWETPQNIFDALDREFHFTLDPCATHENHKCDNYFTKEDDGLAQPWAGHSVFMNPPYGREITKWIRKAWLSSKKPDTKVVCLLPARTDTRWFHKYCVDGEIWFIKGRLKFGGSKTSAPFPSMVVIFDNS